MRAILIIIAVTLITACAQEKIYQLTPYKADKKTVENWGAFARQNKCHQVTARGYWRCADGRVFDVRLE